MEEQSLLKVKDLVKQYHGKTAVQKMSFQIQEGEILGFLGPNGAGKSTTIRMIMGIETADRGEILFQGKQLGRVELQKQLGYVPQDVAVYRNLSAYANVRFFCSLYGYRGEELRSRTKQALEFVHLWNHRKEKPARFSGGMQRRLNIACAIAHQPKLLIMDEPTVGIDPQSRNHIMEAMKELNRRGTTIIYVSHYMEEIEAMCGRIIIAEHGAVIEDMKKEELKEKYRSQGTETLEDIFLTLTGTRLRDEEAVL